MASVTLGGKGLALDAGEFEQLLLSPLPTLHPYLATPRSQGIYSRNSLQTVSHPWSGDSLMTPREGQRPHLKVGNPPLREKELPPGGSKEDPGSCIPALRLPEGLKQDQPFLDSKVIVVKDKAWIPPAPAPRV